jgi:putative redox protein
VVEGTPADDYPKVWVKLNVKYIIKGRGIEKSKVDKAIALSKMKYCAVSAMLCKTAEMTHQVEIIET